MTNSTAGTTPVDDLQVALDRASSGDLLTVRGVCTGTYSVTKSISLVGVPTYEVPVTTLDGGGVDSVLTLNGEKGARIQVTIIDLTIRNGRAVMIGGGVNSRRAEVLLVGSSTVVANQGQYGGGIAFTLGSLTLGDDARVVENLTYATGGYGGGIYLRRGTLTMEDHAAVIDNSAATGGGIYTYKAAVRLRARTAVLENHATNGGGGIFTYDAPVIIGGSATVAGNEAGAHGGGIYLGGYRPGYVSLAVRRNASINHNTSSVYGGGIESSLHGVVTVEGSAEVSANTAKTGGGIFTTGITSLNDDVIVTGNAAETGGGVYLDTYFSYIGTLALGGNSSVTANTASLTGGGITGDGTATFAADWTGTVCGNEPDDWPSCVL